MKNQKQFRSGTHDGLTLAERFWMKVDQRQPSECWPWIASCHKGEYGRMRVNNGRIELASHVLWFLLRGIWPKNHILHTCDHPWCLNPSHVYEGTHAENMADRYRKGRYGDFIYMPAPYLSMPNAERFLVLNKAA